AFESIGEPTTQISVSDRQTTTERRMVATVGSTKIRLWTLTSKSFTAFGAIDCSASPVTACLLFHRSTPYQNDDFSEDSMVTRQLIINLMNEASGFEFAPMLKLAFQQNGCMTMQEHITKCALREHCPEGYCKSIVTDFSSVI
ncbi:hypothetical protein PFISCL1PPCAC_20817, partial [Pristionchus fissidentatus]